MGKLRLYTDGACSQNGTWKGGWAVVSTLDNTYLGHWSGSEEDTTINQMELTAFREALTHITKNDKNDEYSLYSKQSKWFQAEERIKGPVDIKRAIVSISLPNEAKWIEEEGKYIVTHYKGSTTRTLRKSNEPIPRSILNMYKNVTTLLKKNNISYTIR